MLANGIVAKEWSYNHACFLVGEGGGETVSRERKASRSRLLLIFLRLKQSHDFNAVADYSGFYGAGDNSIAKPKARVYTLLYVV